MGSMAEESFLNFLLFYLLMYPKGLELFLACNEFSE